MDSNKGHLRPPALNECEARIYYRCEEQPSASGPGLEPFPPAEASGLVPLR